MDVGRYNFSDAAIVGPEIAISSITLNSVKTNINLLVQSMWVLWKQK